MIIFYYLYNNALYIQVHIRYSISNNAGPVLSHPNVEGYFIQIIEKAIPSIEGVDRARSQRPLMVVSPDSVSTDRIFVPPARKDDQKVTKLSSPPQTFDM